MNYRTLTSTLATTMVFVVLSSSMTFAKPDDKTTDKTRDAVENSSVKISPVGTLLMAMYVQGVTRGRVAILGVSATYNQSCAAITKN